MFVFIALYGMSCIFVKHTKSRALRLRENFLNYIAIPIFRIKIECVGTISNLPALYVSNHRSFADPIIICAYLRAFVIAKAEVKHYPIINKGAELTGVIWVDRQDKTSRTVTRDKMVETIQSGFNVLVFPEGTVGTEATTLPFKKGSFVEAAENNIPVIPVAIEFKSKKDLWIFPHFVTQYFYQFSKPTTYVKLHFGQPIFEKDGIKLHDLAFNEINQQLAEFQKKWSEVF